MADKVDAEKVVGLALVPVGAGEQVRDRGDLRILPRNTAAKHNSNAVDGMEEVIHQFHLAGCNPINSGDGIQGKAFPVQVFGGENYLVRLDDGIQVIAAKGMFDCLKRDRNTRQQSRIR